ncbi:HOOK-domain-containing protein [Suillus fuscotomentosus]|uniref:HOOK-domain-containing protein n=1 Tax=Suillus fuscotomentosus TaxID=1912939 RepID=A0AAD4HLD9_9AGAM|nr:HOOK-domain-containing protein [Suillus fuscotomentosus]KAG1900747.1 HOOK-domain-containing protein [Suillus fuscotomentosus]
MSEQERREINAFISFFATFNLARPITTVADLSDGAALFDVLALVDAEYFRQSSRSSTQLSDNWVLRFSALKRLYRLLTQYFAEVLQKPTSGLEVPDLQAIAKDRDVGETLIMCRITIAIAVQCEQNKEIIARIQQLSEGDQHFLMKAIEQVISKISDSQDISFGEASMTEDDHYYLIQSERSQILSEKETVEKVYQALLEEHRTLQTNYDDMISEKDDALTRLREAQRGIESRRNDNAYGMMRAEVERLRTELQKSEDNLAMAEAELDKHTLLVTDLTRRIDELQVKADEAARLKDQVDEYRHAADRLQKTENVMEKYKKKLQEGADLRQHVKSLEAQNADLVDKNAALEEDYRKVAAFRPLLESYKNQIAELEGRVSTRSQDIETVKFELEQARTKLKITTEERKKDTEMLELYQERMREMELTSHRAPTTSKTQATEPLGNNDELTEEELMGNSFGLDGELDDAITGTTMTDLKLQVKKLQRELKSAKKNEADTSHILVLQNLLEDANRMKARYEADYMTAHREKLVLQRDLEEIRSGKALGDGPEAAIALRQRLNETVDQLDSLRKEHAELEVAFDTQERELTIAKSNLNLVNKDQVDILASLRESLKEDKAGMEADMNRLKNQIRELNEKNKMLLEQVNGLLLEKANLQSDGIGQRDKMIQRERIFGDLRASVSGKDVPEDVKARLLALHEDNVVIKEQLKTAQDKLAKARQFIKSQDKLFKEEQAKLGGRSTSSFEEAEGSFQTQIKDLKEEVQRERAMRVDLEKQRRKEQALMSSCIFNQGMVKLRNASNPSSKGKPAPTAWLPRQRNALGSGLER